MCVNLTCVYEIKTTTTTGQLPIQEWYFVPSCSTNPLRRWRYPTFLPWSSSCLDSGTAVSFWWYCGQHRNDDFNGFNGRNKRFECWGKNCYCKCCSGVVPYLFDACGKLCIRVSEYRSNAFLSFREMFDLIFLSHNMADETNIVGYCQDYNASHW